MIDPRVWGLYGRRKFELAQRQGIKIYNQRAYEDANALDAQRRYTDLAEFWTNLFIGLTPERLAEALVDGVAPRYLPVRVPVDNYH